MREQICNSLYDRMPINKSMLKNVKQNVQDILFPNNEFNI